MTAKDGTPQAVCFYPRFASHELGGVAVHIRYLARHLQKLGFTIVDTPDENTLIHAHAQARPENITVYSNHGIYPIKDKMPAWQIGTNAAIFDNLKLATEIIAVSNWTANQWQHLVGRQPHIIHNSIDMDEWHSAPAGQWRARLKVPNKTPLILWGKTSLSDVLDPTPLIELALHHPNMRFVAPLTPRMLTTSLKNLSLIGQQPFEDMRALLQDCDVYLATVQENHSIQVLEAMALKKPILGYNWGGTGETLNISGQTRGGILTEPRDLIKLIALLPEVYEQRVKLGQDGHELVAEYFSAAKQMPKLVEVYKMALEKKPRQSRASPIVRCSIVIPVYNKGPYIGETVNSALRQINAPKHEVIVVDDGSTDDSLLNARRAAEGRTNIRFYSLPNGGVSAARNFGISHAKGEYICCLDADDLIDPNFLSRLSAALDADPGLGIAYSDFVAFGTNQRGMPFEAPITCEEYDFEKLKRGNLMPCCNLFRRTAWERAGGYKPINPSWEDYELWLNMGKLGWYGRRVPGHLFKYRKVPKTGRDYQSQGLEWKLRATVNSYHRDLYPPLVSIIIPCYKHSHFLRTAIDSVLAQTFNDYEVLVVDDGNDADELNSIREIVESYANPNVRVVRHTQNMGLAAARNTGVEMARGQWIVPLDADDKLAHEFLEEVLRASEQLNPNRFVYADTYLWWPDADPETKLLAANDYNFDESLSKITWSCTILFHRDAWQRVGGYKPQMSELGGWEDWEFAISLGENGICGVHVAKPLFYYRQHSNTQMRMQAESNKPVLQEAIRRLHSEVYRGERTQMCCGAGKRTRPVATVDQTVPVARTMPQIAAATSNTNDRVLIRYVGTHLGSQTWVAPSGERYRFGLNDPLQRVRYEDVDFFISRGPFRQVTA